MRDMNWHNFIGQFHCSLFLNVVWLPQSLNGLSHCSLDVLARVGNRLQFHD